MADMSMMNAERTITIEGDLTKSEEALKLIMDKLRACYEHDMQSAYQVILTNPKILGIYADPLAILVLLCVA